MNKIDLLIPIWNISSSTRRDQFINTIESIDREFFNLLIADFSSDKQDYKEFYSCADEYYYEKREPSFEKSYKINKAVKQLIKDDLKVFVVIDADVVFPADIAHLFNRDFHPKSDMFFGNFSAFLVDPSEEDDDRLLSFDSKSSICRSVIHYDCGPTWFTNKKTFDYVGGFDEAYKDYGIEDADMFQSVYLKGVDFYHLDIPCRKQRNNVRVKSSNPGLNENYITFYKKFKNENYHDNQVLRKIFRRACYAMQGEVAQW